ncbi:MAG: tyrosine decarboxylase MfnA [Methanolinea sp.]|nr:tyrosine decarboxylase MfnA [Methanolinea sp.]
MREKGQPEDLLFSFLQEKRRQDINHNYILSSMCTVPHPVAVRAHVLFMETNLGDPGLFPGTSSLEALLVERIGSLFHLPGACGYATSGGTESNIQALRIAKCLSRLSRPNVIVPESAHFSFQKACDILGLEMRTAPLDSGYRMDAGEVPSLIDQNTCAIVGVAGTTEYGVVDPIGALSDIALDHDIFLHVDAAFGGMVLPFMEACPSFDFSLPGVSSIAVDPHKMGMSTIPAGVILVRDREFLSSLSVDTPYLSVKQEFTLSGTRPGGSVVGALAVLEYLGREGMADIVAGCMKNTWRLIDGMEAFGISRATTPDVNVATFEPARVPPPWRVSWTRKGHMRIVCMPHVHASIIETFLKDIGDSNA